MEGSQEIYLLRAPLEGSEEPGHAKWCRWPSGPPCREFSTDGTLLGAEIAHAMGTTSDAQIALMGRQEAQSAFVSDVEEEQADWDSLE